MVFIFIFFFLIGIKRIRNDALFIKINAFLSCLWPLPLPRGGRETCRQGTTETHSQGSTVSLSLAWPSEKGQSPVDATCPEVLGLVFFFISFDFFFSCTSHPLYFKEKLKTL